MVELNDVEMKEAEPNTGSSNTNNSNSKDEKKDSDTLTIDGSIEFNQSTFPNKTERMPILFFVFFSID